MPEDGYGWEKLFSERMARHFFEDFGLETRVARYHNVYGPEGTWDGGREKAPAAICRKVAAGRRCPATNEIEIWGDGEQTRSFTYIDDCVEGTLRLTASRLPASRSTSAASELVTINELVDIVEEIAGVQLERRYKLDAPQGVRGRNSDNTLIRERLGWEPSTSLEDGLASTYEWVYDADGRRNARRRGMPADGGPLRQPIVVLGAPRSGTSLLAGILGAHPDVTVIGEPRLVWRYGNDAHSDELGPEHATPPVVEHIRRHFAGALAEAEARAASQSGEQRARAALQSGGQSGRRLVEKTPANAVRPRFVDAVFPDARFVHITRDGWAAVPSMRAFWERRGTGFDAKQAAKLTRRLREARPAQVPHYAGELLRRVAGGRHVPLYGPRLAGLQQVADEQGRLAAAALQWRTCVERTATFGRLLPPDRYFEVQLESLGVADVARIVEFCGLRSAPEVLDRFRQEYRIDAARHRAEISDDERALIAPAVVPVNTWLGYDEDNLSRPSRRSMP